MAWVPTPSLGQLRSHLVSFFYFYFFIREPGRDAFLPFSGFDLPRPGHRSLAANGQSSPIRLLATPLQFLILSLCLVRFITASVNATTKNVYGTNTTLLTIPQSCLPERPNGTTQNEDYKWASEILLYRSLLSVRYMETRGWVKTQPVSFISSVNISFWN